MRWNELGKFLIISLAIIGGFIMYINPLANSIKQGLDLQGGTHVVLQAIETPEAKIDDDALNRTVKIIERRVNELGLTEPVIQRQGKDRIIVELPGIKDPDQAINMLGRTAMLEFKDVNGTTVLTGKDLRDARAQMTGTNQSVVGLEFTDEGGAKFADLTARNIGRPISILLDGEVLTSPVVQEAITGGKAQISGSRSMEEAEHLAILLRSGSLPVKIEVMENRTVGPTLGQDSKEKSIVAFSIAIVGIFAFMLLFYRIPGIVADIALLLYVMLLLLIMRYLDATLTLPGIAGIILSIAMAIDANVLIFEHFKEEVAAGKTLRSAMDKGFSRAFVTIFDSNITTLIAALILFYLGTGPIRGFAVTLGLGVVLSMLLIVLVLGVVSVFTRGFNMGIDFTGGSIVDLTFNQEVTVAQVRDVLTEHGMGNSIIQLENSTNNEASKSVLIRTGLVEDEQLRAAVNDMKALGDYQINRMENIGATIGEELIEQAAMAVVLSWLLMIVYITYRFEFNFAVAAVAALVIDVFVTISYFSFFQMELDSSFVAALLTVVGFSINGTVVIFDRIRENLKLHRRSEGLEELVETSIWQCMTRTVYTESTALFAVLVIFLYGGATIHNFMFAMLVGFASGGYTSICLAGPMWIKMRERKNHKPAEA